jgi:hypothetical protein
MNANLAIAGAVFKKDCLGLLPLVLLSLVVNMLDVFVLKLDILRQFAMYVPVLWFATTTLLIFSVLQLDSPVSLVDDWLCRLYRSERWCPRNYCCCSQQSTSRAWPRASRRT